MDCHGCGEKTGHFRERLRELGVPLKDKKRITFSDYDAEKVILAIKRARELHIDKQELSPKYLATTVYLLLQKVMDMLPGNDQGTENDK